MKDRSIVASITDRQITADLAIRTVKKAIKAQGNMDTIKLIFNNSELNFIELDKKSLKKIPS